MNRRRFIHSSLLLSGLGLTAYRGVASWVPNANELRSDPSAETSRSLAKIVNAAQMGQWSALAIGERTIMVANRLQGIPYVGGTLEGEGEYCRINLEGLDCVTFFELSLDIARMLGNGGTSMAHLEKEVTYTRYRNGVIDGYVSRLHYTAEWIADNVRKKVVSDITPELNGIPFNVHVNFMSTHPQYYAPLKENPALIDQIRYIEQQINSTPRTIVPKDAIAKIEGSLKSGDVIAIATSKPGLDYAHTGLITVIDAEARFMHASLTQKKVIVDRTISEYMATVPSHTGISVLRPL